MQRADSNERNIKVYVKTEEFRKWYEKNQWEFRKQGISMSRVIEEDVMKCVKYPHNVAELTDRLLETRFTGGIDTKALTVEEWIHLIEVREVLNKIADSCMFDCIIKAFNDGDLETVSKPDQHRIYYKDSQEYQKRLEEFKSIRS